MMLIISIHVDALNLNIICFIMIKYSVKIAECLLLNREIFLKIVSCLI